MVLLARSSFDEDHDDFRGSVRRFVADEVATQLDMWRAAHTFPVDLLRALGSQGFLGTSVPEQYGGGGVDDPRFTAVLVEELALAGSVGLALVVARHAGVAVPAMLRAPESDQRAGWLQGMASGELLAVPVVLRAGAEARAVPAAAQAGLFVVVDTEGRARAVSADRVTVESAPLLGGHEAGAGDVRVAESASYDDVPDASILLRDLDLWSAVVATAAAEAALDLTRTYVRDRKVFGRPIASFENTQFRLAEIGSELTAARLLVDAGLADLAAGSLTRGHAAAARLVAEQVHGRSVDQGMQLHGGYGYMREYPISHAFSDAGFLRVMAASASEPRHLLAEALGL